MIFMNPLPCQVDNKEVEWNMDGLGQDLMTPHSHNGVVRRSNEPRLYRWNLLSQETIFSWVRRYWYSYGNDGENEEAIHGVDDNDEAT